MHVVMVNKSVKQESAPWGSSNDGNGTGTAVQWPSAPTTAPAEPRPSVESPPSQAAAALHLQENIPHPPAAAKSHLSQFSHFGISVWSADAALTRVRRDEQH